MRNQKDQRITGDRDEIESNEGAPVAPAIGPEPPWVGIDGTDQGAQTIIETDDEYTSAEGLEIFREETHPQFLTRPNDKNRNQDDDEIALEREEISNLFPTTYVRFRGIFHAA